MLPVNTNGRFDKVFPQLTNHAMNRINPEKLLNSKWTAVQPVNRARHFIVTRIIRSDDDLVTGCELEAVLTRKATRLDWRELKDSDRWLMGWK